MFAAICGRYDLANHLLSGGFDFFWRARAARLVAGSKSRRILDLATGSGDLARELGRTCPEAFVIGADFCLPMLEMAREKKIPRLIQADGTQLPFRDAAFDALTVAFGLRNMASWDGALREMARVLGAGGLIVVMDFSLPAWPPLRWCYRLYLHHMLPWLAGAVTGHPEAYEYLGESIEGFPRGESMLQLFRDCGFEGEEERPLCFGVACIYTARKCKE